MANFELWERATLNEFAREAARKLLENEAEIERLRDALSGLLDRNITYSGSDVVLPFASHGVAIRQVSEARRLMTPNAQ